MGTDEYDKSNSSISLDTLVVPLIVLLIAAAAAFAATASPASAYELYDGAKHLASTNHILQAFVGSSVIGLISYAFILTGNTILGYLRGRTFCSITISNKDESFEKVIEFIGKQGIVQSGCLIATTYQKRKTWKDWKADFLMGVRNPPSMNYNPANNNDVHVIRYDGARILMHRRKGETVVAGWERLPMEMETLTLSSFGANVKPLKKLINDALKASFAESQDELTIFTMSGMWGGGWEKALSKKPRAIDSVILDEDLADGLLADARSFLNSSKWYESVGIPFRRGYLLYGPPGCGKTSFCQALAGALKLDICMLTLSNKNLDDNGLAACLRDAPANAIVLLEDVDAVFVERSVQSEGTRGAGVTFSGLLNALDGVASQEGRLFFMTTNHIEKLDPALIRPGRCDVKVEVRRASRAQAYRLYTRFFGDAPEEDALAFSEALPEYELSMAALQGYLLEHKTDPKGALAHVTKLLRTTAPKDVDRTPVFDHLRRVGLEGYAALFEYHGYNLRADLRGLSIDTVKGWSGYLRIDAKACKRMELLLNENEALMAEYQLIDMATAKEMFIAVYGSKGEQDEPAVVTTPDSSETESPNASPLPPLPVRIPSDGAKAKKVAAELAHGPLLSKLADQLCSVLTKDGKAAASIWQVRHHLHLYAHSAAEAVSTAAVLVEPSPPCGADALAVDDLSAYEWLRRAGLETHAATLEENGYGTARALYGLPENVLKDDLGIKDKHELKKLTALCNADAGHARALLGFTSPDYARLRVGFLAAFATQPEVAALHASDFARSLSDRSGASKISLHMLEQYLADFADKGAAAAAASAKATLLEHTRPEPPAKPEPPPPKWVETWLKEHDLAEASDKLLKGGFVEKDDLKIEPRLSMEELKELGVEKAAVQRKVFHLIKGL